MFVRDINTERELFTWLMTYMQRGKKRLYPDPVLVFTDAIIKNIPYGLHPENIADGMDGLYADSTTNAEVILAGLFAHLSVDQELGECPERIVRVAAAVYDELCRRGRVSCRTANRVAIWHLGLGFHPFKKRREYFREVDEDDGFSCLVGTPLLARKHGIVVELRNKGR